MTPIGEQPVLYVGHERESQEAVDILEQAGFDIDVRRVPITHPVAVRFGTPVLFGFSGKFEGVHGVRIFVKNARLLGYTPGRNATV